MTAGEFVYLIKADRSELNSALDSSEKGVKKWGSKLSSWSVAKGQLIADFAKKAVTSVGRIAKDAMSKTMDAYSTFEQLEGGTKLMFGEAYDFVMKKASEAYKNVQMSQNEYLEQANAFATGLKTSLKGDAQAAANLADRIITAQADVVAATGASQEAVAHAFTGLMRNNFTMLDNLQLGIVPTKEGFNDLIKTVNNWNKANGKATKYQLGNLADMQSALIDYIEMQGMAGYAGKEAADTIQGTMASTKAAWKDLLVAFGSGQNVKQATKNLAESVKKMLKNMLPVFKNALSGIGDFIKGLIPELVSGMGRLSEKLKNSDNPIVQFIGKGVEVAKDAINGLSMLINDFPGTIQKLKDSDSPVLQMIGNGLDTVQKVLAWIEEHQTEVVTAIGAVIAAFEVGKIASFVSSLNPVALTLALLAAGAFLLVTNWETVKATLVKVWEDIKIAAEMAWNIISKWWEESIAEPIEEAWGTISAWFDANVFKPIGEFFESMWASLTILWNDPLGLITAAWNGIASWFDENVWQPIKEFFSPVWEAIEKLWNGVKDNVESAWKAVKTALKPILDPIKSMFNGVKDAVQGIIDTVSNVIGEIQKFLGLDGGTVNLGVNVNKKVVSETVDDDGVKIKTYEDGSDRRYFPEGGASMGGSFAKGNWDVPYDNFPALLHRDEMVLTKSQARKYRDGEGAYNIGADIGAEIRAAMGRINVLLNGEKVGDLTTRRIDKNITANSYSRLRAMGG